MAAIGDNTPGMTSVGFTRPASVFWWPLLIAAALTEASAGLAAIAPMVYIGEIPNFLFLYPFLGLTALIVEIVLIPGLVWVQGSAALGWLLLRLLIRMGIAIGIVWGSFAALVYGSGAFDLSGTARITPIKPQWLRELIDWVVWPTQGAIAGLALAVAQWVDSLINHGRPIGARMWVHVFGSIVGFAAVFGLAEAVDWLYDVYSSHGHVSVSWLFRFPVLVIVPIGFAMGSLPHKVLVLWGASRSGSLPLAGPALRRAGVCLVLLVCLFAAYWAFRLHVI